MLKKFQKVVEFRYKFAPPGCSPWQARNIDRVVVISFLRLTLPKGRLCSAVEGTPKGVQMCYASATQSVLWLSCHQLCFRLPSAKDVFFTQLINTFGDVKSPVASTLFVLDSQIFLFMTATLRFQCSDGVTVTTGCNICLSASSRRSALGIQYQCSTCEK